MQLLIDFYEALGGNQIKNAERVIHILYNRPELRTIQIQAEMKSQFNKRICFVALDKLLERMRAASVVQSKLDMKRTHRMKRARVWFISPALYDTDAK